MAYRTTGRQAGSSSQKQVSNLLISAAAGSVVGATAALLLAPKSGEKLRKDISDTYHNVTDKAQDFANDFAQKGQKAASLAADYAENVKDSTSQFLSKSRSGSNSRLSLLAGALGGALLGATAVLIAAPRESEEEIGSFTNKIKDAGKSVTENLHSIDWFETAKEIFSAINEKIHHHNGETAEPIEEENESRLNEALEWAALGLRVWQNLKKRS